MNIIEARNYMDESTTQEYRFVFYCDCCNKIIADYKSKNPNCYKPKLFSKFSQQKAKELLWIQGHDKAVALAKQEAISHLNRCEICGKLVCDDCFVVSNKLEGGICCKDCAKNLEKT